ncbi:MAG: PqqD family protein [Lachnospiraceae bacterium]|nr:PqqD family protein [Lachnospiraceae bacterium]MBP5254166.1 PqqD family protein [Lachnospiraceae bacterium]
MKLKKGFLIRQLSAETVLVPVGKRSFAGLVRLNRTAAFIVQQIRDEDVTEEQILARVLEKYDVDRDTAMRDIGKVLGILRSVNALEES